MVGAWIGNRTTALAHHDMSHNVRLRCGRAAALHVVSTGAGRESVPGPAGADTRWSGRHHGRHPGAGLRAFPEAARRTRGGAGRRNGAGRCAVLPRDVVAPGRRTRKLQRDDQLLVEHLAGIHGHASKHAAACACSACAIVRNTEKRAWRAMFDYYVFGPADKAAAHLPEGARGNLAPMDETKARRLRAQLLQRLNR